MRGLASALAVTLLAAVASAQPAPCDECARGDAVIAKFSLEPVREIAGELARLSMGTPLTPEQYGTLVELRQRVPALVRLGAVDDADFARIAAALCGESGTACVATTRHALQCLADRCDVALPQPPPERGDVAETPRDCHRFSTRKRSLRYGVGIDWGTGWQRSRYPTDGRAWSLGLAGRVRIGPRLGVVARVDRVVGRDEATDVDGDGQDDLSTGSITRIATLAGPSIVLDHARLVSATRFLRVDLLGGYVATRSQAEESGIAAGLDVAYQLSVLRFGARLVQGFGDARDATMVLAHIGFSPGASPYYDDSTDCGAEQSSRSSRVVLGFEFPLGGYGISEELGYVAAGIAIEGIYHLSARFDAMTRADLLVFPGDDRDRVIHQAVLAGMRIDHGKRRRRSSRTGLFTTLLAGYSHGATLSPSDAGSGAVGDLSIAWGLQGREGAANVRLHARFGIGPDNLDYRVVFVSAGFELRFDPRRWRDRT